MSACQPHRTRRLQKYQYYTQGITSLYSIGKHHTMWRDYRVYVSYYSTYDDIMIQYIEFQSNYNT